MGSLIRGHHGPPSQATMGDACMDLHPVDVVASHAAALLDTVEHQIIPRLMLLHRSHEGAANLPGSNGGRQPALGRQEVESFTEHLLHSDAAVRRHLQRLVDNHVPTAALYLDLMAPAARRLGELWLADLCDFTQVTIALGRLQGLLRGVSGSLPRPADGGRQRRLSLFLPAPGEQHTLGLLMVRDFFRASGWDVWSDEPEREDDLLRLLGERSFDLLGFSIGSERHVDRLAALIASSRRASAQRHLRVLVGGPLLLQSPGLVQRLGADATAGDARQAILAAESMVNARDDDR